MREFTLDSGLWKGAAGDANAAAQQEALSAYNAFLDAAGTDRARLTRGTTVGPAVEKGLTSRPAAKCSARVAFAANRAGQAGSSDRRAPAISVSQDTKNDRCGLGRQTKSDYAHAKNKLVEQVRSKIAEVAFGKRS